MVTLPVPKDCVMEVGGLAFRPDGKLLACTRRGEVWLIDHPESEDPDTMKFKLFASGLHEALGLCVNGKDVYVVQRPELTKLVDTNGDDVADEYQTICDKWGVSGDYHEFAFGPARDKDGNFFVTLNVGFGGGHQSKAPWRGWCVKITPNGDLKPWATGLRSPNGINFSPDGDLFYVDNQGEWVATCAMHEVREGEFYGHPAGLRWVKQSPFAATLKDSVPSGMQYDGQPGKNGVSGMPELTPPCIWFPYGRMGQSASEPRWDTTAGKFGPFAGQCFVGDQMKSIVMRVSLEKIGGRYQGACFPFRSGFECGVNRLVFGPDGSLYVGMTNRGWGSLGGKPYGLQRLVWTGAVPFEIHDMHLTKDGFDVTFTKPLDQATAEKLESYSLKSFTHYYWGTYGSPEVDQQGGEDPGGEGVGGSQDGVAEGGRLPAGPHLRAAPGRAQVGRRRRGAAPGGVLHAEPAAVSAVPRPAASASERGLSPARWRSRLVIITLNPDPRIAPIPAAARSACTARRKTAPTEHTAPAPPRRTPERVRCGRRRGPAAACRTGRP